MTIFDYVVIGIVLLSLIVSLMRGLVREVLSLANWTLAFYVTTEFGPELGRSLQFAQSLPPAAQTFLGYAIAFVLSMLIGIFVLSLVSKLIHAAGVVSVIDRVLGAMFGVVRASAVLAVAMIIAAHTDLPQKPFWRESLLAPYAEEGMRLLKGYLPDKYANWIKY